MNRVIAYLRVSTNKQENDNQRFSVDRFCEKEGLTITEYVEDVITGTSELWERNFGVVFSSLIKGDSIVVAELTRLSRKYHGINRILEECTTKGISVYSIKENFFLKDDIQSKMFMAMYGLASQIERDRISQRTKDALARRKSEGFTLGRRFGDCPAIRELDNAFPYIEVMLRHGISKSRIAPFVGTNRVTLNKYLNDFPQ